MREHCRFLQRLPGGWGQPPGCGTPEPHQALQTEVAFSVPNHRPHRFGPPMRSLCTSPAWAPTSRTFSGKTWRHFQLLKVTHFPTQKSLVPSRFQPHVQDPTPGPATDCPCRQQGLSLRESQLHTLGKAPSFHGQHPWETGADQQSERRNSIPRRSK